MSVQFPAVIELSSLNGRNGFTIDGIAGSLSGISLTSAGDVNDDGIADLIVGASGASSNGQGSGQSHIIFGDNLHLATNQLALTQAETIILTTNNINIISLNHPSSILEIKLKTIKHGQFAFTSSLNSPITQFSQQNIIDDQVQFTHDGSIYPPSYSISCSTGIWLSIDNESATIHSIKLLPLLSRRESQ